jgi:hypothetical protein
MDKNDEIQSSSKKRKEHPVDMLANKTKTELLAEDHSAGIKGSPRKGAGGYYIVKIYSEECNRSKRYLDY